MAAAFVGGAALGAVFGELLNTVMRAKDKILMFKSILQRIEETLQAIIPIIKEIESLNKALDHREEETAQLLEVIRKGNTLVLRCTSIRSFDLWRKSKHTDKLAELEKSLNLFFQIVMQAQLVRDTKQLLLEVKGRSWSSHGKIAAGIPAVPLNPVGFEVPLGELKMELFKDDVSLVVLSGPGGCGKTTLAKLLCHDKLVTEKFKDNIFYVIVSRKNTMEGIVRRIFEYKGHISSEFQSEEDAIYSLEQFLKSMGTDPVLLVLDDVWPDSEYLLQKLEFQIKGYKVLVTSRSSFPRFGSAYKLQPLNYDDSLTLFRNSAFFPNQSNIPEEHIVSKIVKECKGFPLALQVVGGSLRGQPAEIWAIRERELSESGSIFQNYDLLRSLQRSLSPLDKKEIVKECFLDLCAFPEDQRIPVTVLIDMWIELYNLDEDVYAVANLHELSNRNLVDIIATREDLGGNYNQHFIMQHDLLRELGIHQSNTDPIEHRKRLIVEINGNKVPEWWMNQKHLISGRLLSISTGSLSIFTWYNQSRIDIYIFSSPCTFRLYHTLFADEAFSSDWCFMQAPEVEVVVLNFRAKNCTLPEFIKETNKLKVLIVMNYGFFPTELGNFPLLGVPSNLKRIRLEHVSIPSYGFTCTQFKSLQKISIVMCNIGQAFTTSTIQVSEALPSLVEINIDYCNDLVEFPSELCHLIKLKKLNVTNCPKLVFLPREIKELANLEVLRLTSCIELKELPSTIGNLHNLTILDISECFELERLPEETGELQNLSKLHMIGCSNIKLPHSISKLEHLKEVICDEETASLWEPFFRHLQNLRLKVQKEHSNLNWLQST